MYMAGLSEFSAFGFLFWHDGDYSKDFYSPCLENKPCSTGQRANIETLPAANFIVSDHTFKSLGNRTDPSDT